MDFPVTIESQDDFDKLVKSRLDREKTKQDELQQQIDSLTAEKQELVTQAETLTQRAESAEKTNADRDAADAHSKLVADIAGEFGVDSTVLRGATEAELRDHAAVLKQLLTSQPVAPVVPNAGDSPNKPAPTDLERFASELFGGGD